MDDAVPSTSPALPLANTLRTHRTPLAVIVLTGVVLIVAMKLMGRLWWCKCGQLFPWTSQAWGPHNSQHLGDPYFFSHVLHGVVFYWALWVLQKRMHWLWVLAIAAGIEAAWEVFENTHFVINRYRDATAALGYEGDTVFNSLTDWLAAIAGFLMARAVGIWWSIAIYLGMEIWCAWWIRDNLTLNVVMLLYPIDSIRQWQSGG